jgi:hypothetical protein
MNHDVPEHFICISELQKIERKRNELHGFVLSGTEMLSFPICRCSSQGAGSARPKVTLWHPWMLPIKTDANVAAQ